MSNKNLLKELKKHTTKHTRTQHLQFGQKKGKQQQQQQQQY